MSTVSTGTDTMNFNKCVFVCVLFLVNCLAAAQYYGGNELSKVLAEVKKEWNLGVMGTGESHPNEHLDCIILAFSSNAMITPNAARELIFACSKQMLHKLNRCPKLKKRLKNKYFTLENMDISIAFTDKKHKRYPKPYAGDVYLFTKGVSVLSEDEWGYSEVVLEEKLPSDYLEEVQKLCQPFQPAQIQ